MSLYAQKSRKFAALLLLTIAVSFGGRSQTRGVELRTNILYWATTTPNGGIDVALSDHFTLGAAVGYNALNFRNPRNSSVELNPKLRHWVVVPEARWWLRDLFEGSYVSLHLLGGQYNVAGLNFPKFLKKYRYSGYAVGAGISYGHDWRLSERWRVGLQAGISYVFLDYSRYNCGSCGSKVGDYRKSLPLITPVSLSISYLIPNGKKHAKEVADNASDCQHSTYLNIGARQTADPESTDAGPSDAGIKLAEDTYTRENDSAISVTDSSANQAKCERTDTLRLALHYSVGSDNLTHPERLRLDSLLSAISDKNVTSITVEGYASPEYDSSYNRLLSARRASGVMEIIKSRRIVSDSVVNVREHGDDWSGLLRLSDGIPAVRTVIDTIPDPAERKRALRRLPAYPRMLHSIYPQLRRAELTILCKENDF